MSKVILFNFNGTIVNTRSLAITIYNEIAEKKGYKKINEEEVAYLSTLSITDRFKRLNIPMHKLLSLGITIKQRYQKYIPNLNSVDGINEVIHELKQRGYRLGFLTTNSRDVTTQFLTSNSINMFDYTHYSFNPFSKSKDISTFLKRNKLNKKDVIYIGDELRDIKAAKKNQLCCAAVTWGYDSIKLLNSADYVAQHPTDILKIVSEL
ncbi:MULTISPECIES: HAD-IA family hydrolase [Bacillus]|uniref:HAD family hydrolase n=2 Tax=Bacillus TaxID=1386 RepID=A0A0M4FLK1_9BACI|nr:MULTISPECIES: HAD-IA family hydrolase [Bacillus]ALC82941.1 hypothetical protein AM592_16140 [Bacillus gobiensis]MBP1081932.1 phosphoglycolate phosphatase [Bacillus capparidis]MED1096578.1 HAD-IA family hydrolase [Bacillus capparidis]